MVLHAAKWGNEVISRHPEQPGVYQLKMELWLPRPRPEVFEFFGDAGNLEEITPPWLNFRVLTPQPLVLRAGSLIDYRLKLHGIPIRWQTEIAAWEPPFRFVDRQLRGPYRLWVHEHLFEERDGGTWVTDLVNYAAPGGRLVHRFLVQPDLERIFAYREAAMLRRFGGSPAGSTQK